MSTDQADHFDLIEQDYLSSWCRFNPEAAVEAGVESSAASLVDCSDQAISIQIALNEKCMAALDEIDFDELDPERQLHHRILYGHALLEHHALMDHDWRFRDPTRFLPINAIHQLTIRPLENVSAALLSRLQAVPDLLRAAKQYLTEQPALIPLPWLEMALDETSAGLKFCQHLTTHPLVEEAIKDNPETSNAIENTIHALEGYLHALRRIQPKCHGETGCGREHYERLLHHKHFLPINVHTLYQFGEQLLQQSREKLDNALKQADVTLAQLAQSHPSSENLLATYQQEMQLTYQYLIEQDLVTLPTTQQLKVIETPGFLRHQIPFAAYLAPSIADATQTGYYYITPVTDTEALQEHNFAAIAQTCIHEAWPGHHLQFVTANQSAIGSSLLCRLFPCPTLYEGWALYCEQMMLEQGFQRYPHQQIVMLRDRVWRALRIVIDIDIHVHGVNLHDAARRLVDELGFPYEMALAEVKWYSQAPTVPMSYATGWAVINALKAIVTPIEQHELKAFHDKLLDCGSIALPLVIQHQFGDKIWQQCCQHVFGGTL